MMMTCPWCGGPMPAATGIGRPRKYCTPACTQAAAAEGRRKGVPRIKRHKVTLHDEQTRAATCAICGPIKAHRVKDKYADGRERIRWICGKRVAAGPSRGKWAKYNPRAHRAAKLRARGITLDGRRITLAVLDEIEASMPSRCCICRREADLHLDHDHTTGYVRGWLCSTCNTGIGKLGDSAALVARALDYLREPPLARS